MQLVQTVVVFVRWAAYRAARRPEPGGAADAIAVLAVTGRQAGRAGGHGAGGGGLGHTL